MMDYGFRSPIWMLKALIINAPRDQVDNMLTTLIDYLDNEEHISTEVVLELMAQLTATGAAVVSEQLDVEEIINGFREELRMDEEEDGDEPE